LLWNRLDMSKSVVSAFFQTILLIDAFNYKMMITCIKLMPWVYLTANKGDMTHFPISITLSGKTTWTWSRSTLKLATFSTLCPRQIIFFSSTTIKCRYVFRGYCKILGHQHTNVLTGDESKHSKFGKPNITADFFNA